MSFIFYFGDGSANEGDVPAFDSKAKAERRKTRQLRIAANADHMVDIYIDDYGVRLEGEQAREFADSMMKALRRANLLD